MSKYRERAAREMRTERPSATVTPIMRKLVEDSRVMLGRGPADARERAGNARAFAIDHLEELHERDVRDVLVCPVGFVADHLEIRWDLDHEAREKALVLGIHFARIEMPNAHPAFVATLANIVRRALAVPSQA